MWSHDMKWKILERPLLCIVMQIMTRKNSYRTKLPIFCQRTCNMCVMCAYIIHNLTYSPYKYILHTCFSCKITPSLFRYFFFIRIKRFPSFANIRTCILYVMMKRKDGKKGSTKYWNLNWRLTKLVVDFRITAEQ